MTRRSNYAVGQRGRCLTEFSVPVLVAGALVLSVLLWLAIYMVI
ncbi:hypothetical protein RUESEDTHA_01318 [Ruegeria sp. THAF57]|nr:hypothetical protein [Ruegeria sp. THAF57]CAD0184438.1 hypothetical protein RUESEDTHA_01318 [Ruegeria sp. THAF57]